MSLSRPLHLHQDLVTQRLLVAYAQNSPQPYSQGEVKAMCRPDTLAQVGTHYTYYTYLCNILLA